MIAIVRLGRNICNDGSCTVGSTDHQALQSTVRGDSFPKTKGKLNQMGILGPDNGDASVVNGAGGTGLIGASKQGSRTADILK